MLWPLIIALKFKSSFYKVEGRVGCVTTSSLLSYTPRSWASTRSLTKFQVISSAWFHPIFQSQGRLPKHVERKGRKRQRKRRQSLIMQSRPSLFIHGALLFYPPQDLHVMAHHFKWNFSCVRYQNSGSK